MSRLSVSFLIASWAAVFPFATGAEESPRGPLRGTIVLASDEKIEGIIATCADGKLTVGCDPPRTIELDEIERIEIDRLGSIGNSASTDTELIWIGQDNRDLVQPNNSNGGNGIQDIVLHARNLKPLVIRQIGIICSFGKQSRAWSLNEKPGDWRLAMSRGDRASEADLYIEPAAVDSYGQAFAVTITYADDSKIYILVTAATHTSNQLKLDRDASPGVPTTRVVAGNRMASEVLLLDGTRMPGEILSMADDALTLRTIWKTELPIPILRIKGIWFGNAPPAGARDDFDKQMAAPAGEDTVFLLAPDKTAAQVQGNVLGLSNRKLAVRVDGTQRSASQDRLLGVVFAAHPKVPLPTVAYQMVTLTSGDTLPGSLVSMDREHVEIKTLWDAPLKIPTLEVASIRARNGKVAYLSDMEPLSAVETPYFGRMIHWRRDAGFDGGPAKVRGKRPARSIAMHSRTVLGYAIDGQFDRFKATLGFDDTAQNRGRVLCRVLADDKEVFIERDLRADADPVALDVSVAGARQLTLEVDFGEDEDIGDRVIFAEPRLLRVAPQTGAGGS